MDALNGLPHEAGGEGVPTATPYDAAPTAPHFFFMKTSEKKKVLEQQKARAPTPTPTSDDDEHIPDALKPKRARKPKTALKQRRAKTRKARPEPPHPPPPSYPVILLTSTRTEIDPVTAAAVTLLTPSSSPPAIVEEREEAAEAEVDLNPRRSKRQKQTPPPTSNTLPQLTTFRMVVDEETGTVLSSSEGCMPKKRGNLEVSYTNTMLTIRATHGSPAQGMLARLKGGEAPSSPGLLPAQMDEGTQSDVSGLSTYLPKNRRPRVAYDKDTGILSIRSSPTPGSSPPSPQPPRSSPPPPQQPARKNAFALLGKKKEMEKPPARKGKAKKEESNAVPDEDDVRADPKPPTRRSKRSKDKKSDANPPPIEGVDSNPAAVALKPKAPNNKSVHPFFNAASRKNMQLLVPPSPLLPESTEEDANKTDSGLPPRPSSWSGSKPADQKSSWTFVSAFGNSTPKMPGVVDAPWPLMGTSHVRGLTSSEDSFEAMGIGHLYGERKLKDARIVINPKENILSKIVKVLGLESLRDDVCSGDYEMRKYFGVSPEVRLPKRILTTGSQLQEMIRLRVSARLPHPKVMAQQPQQIDSDSDSGSDMVIAGSNVHPALFRLYQRLRSELTAFDMHKCENLPWEVKYAPGTISETLQPGREKKILKEWLMELRTDKVHVDTSAKGKRKAKSKAAVIKKKRKRKGDDMDGFVVTSEEEQDTMDEITDPEEDDWLNPATKTKKSTVRLGDKLNELLGKSKESKKTNTIVISGPTGSGKTSAVYAVAKDLGYVVFEVNPGTRRSGKDVLDLVGDMSRNHIVHHAKGIAETDNPFSKAKTGKEGTAALEEDLQMRQKQSLILFEEVDILFEEDKTFWSTVINLMSKSKRPIVLTCNNESLLPWDDLSLHAILRFTSPPRDLLVDHLLLIAANEGHLLERSAVDALVQSNQNDIRSSIMDLQFYCRMAIGDRKGGLDWLVDRYPIGCDITNNGEAVRVVSQDTYHQGMGMVPNQPDTTEEKEWQDMWEEYGLDIGASVEGLEECARATQADGVNKAVSLMMYETFFEARSAADGFSSLAGSWIDQPKLDFSHPKRTEKHKLDDLFGYSIVQTDPYITPGSVETNISIYMRSLARCYLATEIQKASPSIILAPLSGNSIAASVIRRHELEGPTKIQLQDLFASLSKAETLFASTPATTHSSVYPSVRTLVVEVAPWVRSILRFDIAMEKERRKASSLLSLGGKRRTRAARLAVEGGDRRRKERWLRGLAADVVGRSAGEDWDFEIEVEEGAGGEEPQQGHEMSDV